MSKKAGILLHISSLPNEYGIGTFGKSAYQFVDFLEATKQSYWQVLPMGPTSYGDSPYQAVSVFAYNQYFIDFDLLKEDGLLKESDYIDVDFGNNQLDIDYAKLFNNKNHILKLAYKNHQKFSKEFNDFKEKNNFWLNDYATFLVLKEEFNFMAWNTWPIEFKIREPKIIDDFQKDNFEIIDIIKFIQFLFYRQWEKLRDYANKKNIEIIGDMPIYVAYDSSDVWSNPEMFYLNEKLAPIEVAGCPPDAFSEDGQLWGNPLYNWDYMKNSKYSWWVKRIEKAFEIYDVVRIDHFRGFAGYFAIPFGDKTARNGSWRKGPGYDLFKTINEELNNPKIIAENLGFLDDEVLKLLNDCKYPGMHILQFEFGNMNDYIPIKDDFNSNNIIYSGTHDNQMLASWYLELDDNAKKTVDEIANIKSLKEVNQKLIELCMSKSPDLCIIPIQDYLELNDETGRMNTPSTTGKNWRYRMSKKDITKKLIDKISKITIKYNRF